MRNRITIGIISILLLSGLAAWGQGSTSSITGLVTDSTGAVIAGAKIEAKNEATGSVYVGTTTGAGTYAFAALIPGEYSISVTQMGFQKYVSVRNVLTVGQPLVVDISLKVGATGETVQVDASYERIETTNATISDVMTETQVKNLPLNGRNPLALLTLEPGVTQRTTNGVGSGTHVFGSRDRSHNVTIDGIDANESTVPNPQSNLQRLNPDNVQEFRTVTLGATAETGRNSGANVMIATKAGTNTIHGSVFHFLRNTDLNANEWYNNTYGQDRPKLNLNQFGFDIGGPLIKNRTFWFGSFQHNIIKQSAPISSALAATPVTYTSSLRNGIFRYVKGTVVANGVSFNRNDPRLVDAGGNLVAGVTPCATSTSTNCIASFNMFGTGSAGTNDPQNIGPDPKMQAFANSLPLPNAFQSAGDGLNYSAYTWNSPTKFTGPNTLVRIDHTFNASNNVFVRWLQNHYNTSEGDFLNARPQVYPGFSPLGEVNRNGKNLAVSYRHTFTPNLVNEFTGGFNRFVYLFTWGESNPGFGDLAKVPPYTNRCAAAASLTLMRSPNCLSPHTARGVTADQFIDNLSWVRGSHTIRAGFNFRFYQHNDSRGNFGSAMTAPDVIFGQSTRASGFRNLPTTSSGINSTDLSNLNQAIVELAGIPSQIVQSFPADYVNDKYQPAIYGTAYTRAHQYDMYVQDEWKLRPDLTLNLGLRWELNPAPYDALQSFQPDHFPDGSQGPVTFVKSDRWFKTNNVDTFAPRLGVAWSPDNKTSVRAGYAMLFDTLSTFQVTAIGGKVPGYSLTCSNTVSTTGAITTSNGCVAPSGLTGTRIASGFPTSVPLPTRKPSDALLQSAQPYGTAPSAGAFDPNLKTPTVHQWNLTIQRELPFRFVSEVGYIGKHGTHLYRAYDLNQIDPTSKTGFLDSFNIAHSNVLKGCRPDGTGCPTGITGQAPTLLLSLVSSTFLNASSRVTNFTRNDIGALSQAMDSLGATDTQRVGLPINYFRPNPQFSDFFFQDAEGSSTYHALFAAARRRFEQGLTFSLSYTWSKSIDDMSVDPTGSSSSGGLSTTSSRTPTDIHNFRLDRAVSDFDNTHVISANMLFELPFGKGRKFASGIPTWLNYVIGGWSTTGIFNYQSGEPFTLQSGALTTNNQHVSGAVIIGPKPGSGITYNVTGVTGPVLYQTGGFVTNVASPDLNCQVLTNGQTKFCIPAAGQQGSARNTMRGPNFWNLDSGLAKDFSLTERFKLQFRAEAFNVLNHPNFENARNATTGSPTLTSSQFGNLCCVSAAVAASANVNPIGEPMRVMQLSLKLNF